MIAANKIALGGGEDRHVNSKVSSTFSCPFVQIHGILVELFQFISLWCNFGILIINNVLRIHLDLKGCNNPHYGCQISKN